MTTITASGTSKRLESRAAAAQAVEQARAKLGKEAPHFGFLFASPEHHLRDAMAEARKAAGVDLLGCTTAGEVTERGLTHGGLAVLLVSSDSMQAHAGFAGALAENPSAAADELDAATATRRKAAGQLGRHHSTTVVLTDGLAGTGEHLVEELFHQSRAGSQIVGGAAGDEGKFVRTEVAVGPDTGSNAAASLQIFSTKRWGVGVNHGLRSTTKQLRVTRAERNVVYELDGRPAFEHYVEHAAQRGVRLAPESASPYLVANELGIHFFDKIARVRAPLSVGPGGSLRCAAEIPSGSIVSILDGDADNMIEAARSAAIEAHSNLMGEPAAGVLLFDCVCRGMILKAQFQREIDAVRSVFGDLPVAGFLTYGEIARYKGRLDGWHNATAVVVAIPR
jgi:hypothetical protein